MQNIKDNKDIIFVILHYIEINETKASVKKIKENVDTESYVIVIVDNGSQNGTGELLQAEYIEDSKVKVICLKENLGFAKGNNNGINFAIQNYNFEFIVVMNNDVYLTEKQLFSKLSKEYNESCFSVLGPMILTAAGKCNTNPGRTTIISKREVLHKIKRYKWQLYLSYFRLHKVYQSLNKLYNNVYYYPKHGNKGNPIYKDFMSRKEHAQVHGCFLVFSNEFFTKLNGFDERTFLYMEEDILFTQLDRKGLKSVYLPEIIIFHKEDMSTGNSKKGQVKKMQFIWKNYLKAARVLLKVLEEN